MDGKRVQMCLEYYGEMEERTVQQEGGIWLKMPEKKHVNAVTDCDIIGNVASNLF